MAAITICSDFGAPQNKVGHSFPIYFPWSDGTGCHDLSFLFSSVQFSHSVMSDSLQPNESQQPGLPVHHQLPEFTQTRIHQVSDAIQPSHPLSSPSLPAPNPSQHQSLFQWVNSSHEVAKVLEFQLSHHSFQRNPRADLLQNGLVGSPYDLFSDTLLAGTQNNLVCAVYVILHFLLKHSRDSIILGLIFMSIKNV